MPEKLRVKFSWGWVITSLVLGIAFIALAHLADLVWHWPQVTVGTLTDIGAALLIAFFLFILERRFTRRITDEVRSAAEAAVEEKTQAFGTRLDDLEGKLNQRRADDQAAQDKALASMIEDVSFDSLTTALTEAERVGAIGGSGLTVSASEPEARLTANFRFGPERIYGGGGNVIDDGGSPRFRVSVSAPARPGQLGLPLYDVRWDPADIAEDVGAALETRLKQDDRLTDAKALNFPLALRELQRALRVALENQRAPRGQEILSGKLHEIIGTDWAITSAGLQSLRLGMSWSWDDLGILGQRNVMRPAKRPATPAGVAEAEWIFAYERAVHHGPRSFPFGY